MLSPANHQGQQQTRYIYSAKSKDHLPHTPLVAVDWKENNDYNLAVIESYGYCQKLITHCVSFFPILTIPFSTEKGINCTGQLIKTSILVLRHWKQINHHNMLLFCVKYVVDNYLKSKDPFAVEPIQGVPLKFPLKGKHVYRDGGKVYKLYNTK